MSLPLKSIDQKMFCSSILLAQEEAEKMYKGVSKTFSKRTLASHVSVRPFCALIDMAEMRSQIGENQASRPAKSLLTRVAGVGIWSLAMLSITLAAIKNRMSMNRLVRIATKRIIPIGRGLLHRGLMWAKAVVQKGALQKPGLALSVSSAAFLPLGLFMIWKQRQTPAKTPDAVSKYPWPNAKAQFPFVTNMRFQKVYHAFSNELARKIERLNEKIELLNEESKMLAGRGSLALATKRWARINRECGVPIGKLSECEKEHLKHQVDQCQSAFATYRRSLLMQLLHQSS